jgi:NHL repeat-containing protein
MQSLKRAILLEGRSMKRRRLLVLAVVLLSVRTLASGTCTQVFSAISINGVQYPVQSTLDYPAPIVTGVITLNLQFRTVAETVTPFSGIRLMYTIDNQSVGPVLTDAFASTLDTTEITDGAHTLSVLYIDEPASPCYTFLGRQYVFVVANSGHAVNGTQLVPVVAPLAGYGPVLPQFADFVAYSGYRTHPNSHPFNSQVVAGAGGVTPADLWSEPLLSATSNAGEAVPTFWQSKNGSIIEDPLFTSLIGCDDLRRPKWGFDVAGPVWEQRKAHFDGQQDDVTASSFATFTANLDGPGFYGVSMDGRLFFMGTDGSIHTLAGWVGNRNLAPMHYLDSSIPMAAVHSQETLVGKFDTQFYFPTDLAIDPHNHEHIFVADMNNHRIALVDLSQSPPVISTYAGVTGHAGYLNGPALSSLFNQPSSIAVAPDDTIYVADAENAAIRKIDSAGNVTTLAGLGPAAEPANGIVAAAPLRYAPRIALPFSSAYINYPNVLRFDSKGNLVLAETVTQAIRYLDLKAQTVATIAQFSSLGSGFGEQVWLDVDRNGNIGEKDDIIASMVTGKQNGLYRIPITGTTAIPLPTITTHTTNPIYSGHTRQAALPWTSGPWSVAIDDQEGRLVVTGVESAGVVSLRLLQPTDPVFQLNLADYVAGRNVWLTGTVPNFPFGSRPSFAAVHGFEGYSNLGNVLNFDDLVSMTDVQLGSYLQAGADGSVPRPELTGSDLRNVIYYIRRTAAGMGLPAPGATSSAKIPPAISGLAADPNNPVDATVAWTTSTPTLGFVNWGTTSGTYFGWSPLESTYSTVHSMDVPNLPAGEQIYFVVRAKDQAGNQSVTAEQSFTLP